MPQIKDPYDVIICIAYAGVCGSDVGKSLALYPLSKRVNSSSKTEKVHFWLHGGVKNLISQDRPLVMGHEASGIVRPVGPAGKGLQPSDSIAIEPGSACRLCSRYKAGQYNCVRR
jgi:D-xylulose reductase